MLEAIKLRKTFGSSTALNGLDLLVEPGEVYCLLGANGAGKSTTIKLFLGLIAPTSGSVKINGTTSEQAPGQSRALLGYIPEQVSLYPRLSGIENLQYFAALAGEADLSRSRLVESLAAAGLPVDAVDRRVSNYSKGMRQKVVIALSLVRQVRGLLLDEPTSGLDPQSAHEFSKVLRSLADKGVAILMASHDLYNVRESATKIGIMRRGELVDSMEPSQVDHNELAARALKLM
jgi:ABC-2 type transport system ATP-binding protein